MATYLPLSIAIVTLVSIAGDAWAERPPASSGRPVRMALVGDGRVTGVVFDDTGAAVSGANILATGAAVGLVRTDSRGRFTLVLPAGNYLLRVAREGFVSTYREPLRVESDRLIQRRILLMRRGVSATSSATQAEPAQGGTASGPAEAGPHGHGEMAWRLRYLRRTVLREIGSDALIETDPGSTPVSGLPMPASSAGRTRANSLGGVESLFSAADLTGHISLLTTSSLAHTETHFTPAVWSHGIADVVVGAPMGKAGDWSIRGVVAAGDARAWTLFGEYVSRPDRPHEVRLAVSYSTQGLMALHDLGRPAAGSESRSAGSVEAADRWAVRPSLEIDYGIRFDRLDYLAESSLFSPHAGMRLAILPRTFVVAASSQRMVAPGANEFRPPSESGPWLPPARAFHPLVPEAPLRPERLRRHAAGIEREIRADTTTVVRVEWFRESTRHQMATLFGLDDRSDVGRYDVATVGSVRVTGWRLQAESEIGPHVHGRVEYAEGRAEWDDARGVAALRQLDPALARWGSEAVSTLRTSFDVALPPTATHLEVRYQLNRVSAGPSGQLPAIAADGFDLELRQRLPYQPLNRGLFNALFTLSTLAHDHDSASFYDEILTAGAPLRLTAGLQLGF
jgi:hypothetical protein